MELKKYIYIYDTYQSSYYIKLRDNLFIEQLTLKELKYKRPIIIYYNKSCLPLKQKYFTINEIINTLENYINVITSEKYSKITAILKKVVIKYKIYKTEKIICQKI